MTDKAMERKPAQLPVDLHQWATDKADEIGVPIAAVWRGLTPMLREAEQRGIRLQPAQPERQQAQA